MASIQYKNIGGPVQLVQLVKNKGEGLAGIETNADVFTPKGYQQLDNGQLATAQALNVPAGATIAMIQNNHTQPMRWLDTGAAPTSTTGLRIVADPTVALTYTGDLSAFRIIRQADGTGTVDIWYGA